MKIKGYAMAAIAAASYGTNPAFAIPLYDAGMNPTSVLLFRYLLSLPILLAMMFWRGQNLRLQRSEIMPVAILGIFVAMSSLTLFEAYKYMNAGVASTLLFMYPVMVAVIMCFFFHEKFHVTTGISLLVMGAGLVMLTRSDGDGGFSLVGFLLVFLSSLTYALYLVMTNVSKKIREIPTIKLLFYQLLIGSSVFLFMLCTGEELIVPDKAMEWVNVTALAVFPTAISFCCTTVAIHCIGSTSTAIFGALEPVTAVLLSILFLGQTLSLNEIAGGLLILIATTMVIATDPIDHTLLRMRKMFPSLRKKTKR